MFVEVPLAPTAKIPRELLTSPGDRMQVGLRIDVFQLRSSGVKATGASRECPSLAMRCVALALCQTWTLNLMVETCCQKPMKTPNSHNMRVPRPSSRSSTPCSKPTAAYSTAGQATHLVNCGRVQRAQVEVENFRKIEHVLFFPRAELTKNHGSLTSTVLSQVLELLVDAPSK